MWCDEKCVKKKKLKCLSVSILLSVLWLLKNISEGEKEQRNA